MSTSFEQRREAMKRRRQLPEMDRRREASQATRDKFIGQRFDWSRGTHCLRMLHFHLRAMGWRSPKLPTLPRVRSALAAQRAMQERGWESVGQMLGVLLTEIPPASTLIGDVVTTPGDEGFESVMIFLALRRYLGFLPDGREVSVVDIADFSGAWRV